MKVKYYHFLNDKINLIKEWFNQAFGFMPTTSNTVEFCVKTVISIDAGITTRIKHKLTANTCGLSTVTIKESTYNSLEKFLSLHDDIFNNDLTLLLSSIIATRAISLPPIPTKIVTRVVKPAKQGYKRRLNLEDDFFFYGNPTHPILIGKN